MDQEFKMRLGREAGLGSGDIVLDETDLPQNGTVSHFRLIFNVAKRLDASVYHLVWRYASALATLC